MVANMLIYIDDRRYLWLFHFVYSSSNIVTDDDDDDDVHITTWS